MHIRTGLSFIALAGAMLLGATLAPTAALAQGAYRAGGPGGPGGANMPPPAKTVEVQLQIEASANLAKEYPGATDTMHHGLGFLAPFGKVEYYCGHGFPEETNLPLNDWEKGFFDAFTGRADALFCTYTTDEGTFYVRDSVAGTVLQLPGRQGGRNMMINLVVGGTGPYQGATGVWTGFTEGLGSPAPGQAAPLVLLKIMNGYVKLPNEK